MSDYNNNLMNSRVMNRVDNEFYKKGCEDLAKHLIGKLVVRIDGEKRLSGMIVEVGTLIF